MQICADVTGREIKISSTPQASALGAAMFGALAAGRKFGVYDSIEEAVIHMASLEKKLISLSQKTQRSIISYLLNIENHMIILAWGITRRGRD